MKKVLWPKKDKPARAQDLVLAVKDAFEQGASWKRIRASKNINWKGPTQGKFSAATSLEYSDWLTAKNLKYSFEEQDRDFLEEILAVAVQLGIEQGRRIYFESHTSDQAIAQAIANLKPK